MERIHIAKMSQDLHEGRVTLSECTDIWYGEQYYYGDRAQAIEQAERICAALNNELAATLEQTSPDRLQIAAWLRIADDVPSFNVAKLLMSSESPNDPLMNVKYWISAEAKYRLMLADELINQSKVQP